MAKKSNNKTKYRVKPDKALVTNILVAAVYIILGILFCTFKAQVLGWLIWIVGILLIVQGAVDLIAYRKTTPAVIEIVLGVLTIVCGNVFVQVVAIVLGIVVILYGLSGLVTNSKNIFSLALNLLTIVAGVLLVLNPNGAIEWMFIVLGVLLIVDGVIALFKK